MHSSNYHVVVDSLLILGNVNKRFDYECVSCPVLLYEISTAIVLAVTVTGNQTFCIRLQTLLFKFVLFDCHTNLSSILPISLLFFLEHLA